MANFILNWLLHRKTGGNITSENPLDTKDANTAEILARANLLASEGKLEEARVLLNTIAGKQDVSKGVLDNILAKIIAAPATEAKQDTINATIAAIKDTAGIKKITDAVDVADRVDRKLGEVSITGNNVLLLVSRNEDVSAITAFSDRTVLTPKDEIPDWHAQLGSVERYKDVFLGLQNNTTAPLTIAFSRVLIEPGDYSMTTYTWRENVTINTVVPVGSRYNTSLSSLYEDVKMKELWRFWGVRIDGLTAGITGTIRWTMTGRLK